jgi:galactofuranosylgalactofuranosylrhamnosyl-N-acetylglucosaminyl-diphospho-decaprenol beta-1,5/1,6-galactofuranosyltransferase
MPDGSSAALYERDPEKFRDLMRRTVEIHARFQREWPRLAAEYRAALGDITSPEAWEKTFAPWMADEQQAESQLEQGAGEKV